MVTRALGVLVVGLWAAPAAADRDLVWQAPAGCPDATEVQARVERRLGAPLALRGIEVVVVRTGDGLVAHVDTRAVTVANHVRQLTSASCDELADAVAVVIARLASEWRPITVAIVDDEPIPGHAVAATPVAPTPASSSLSSPSSLWGGGVRLVGLSGVGTAPRVGVGGELGGYARRGAAFGELALAQWTDPPGGLDVVVIRGGWAATDKPLRAWLGAEVGLDDGIPMAPGRWAAINAGVSVAWPMLPWARLVGTFEVAAVLSRPRPAYAEAAEIRGGSAAARSAFGLEVGWP